MKMVHPQAQHQHKDAAYDRPIQSNTSTREYVLYGHSQFPLPKDRNGLIWQQTTVTLGITSACF